MTRPTRTRHRRLALAAVPVLALLAACGGGSTSASVSASAGGGSSSSSGGARTTLPFAYFQGTVAGPEAVIAANPELADKLSVTLKLIPIDSGVAGIAQLKGGAFPGISGVGNPPTVAAIGKGTDIKVVYVESLDSAALVVDRTISGVDALKGQKVGALVGSTLDFEVRGFLKTRGLTDAVQVTAFPSEAAEVAAFKTGQLHAAYISIGNALELLKIAGTQKLVDATEVAKAGYAALGLLIVTGDYAKNHPDVVQQLVCGVKDAQALLAGPDAAKYITPAAGILGADPPAIIAGTKGYPYVPDAEELAWFKGSDGQVTSGRLVQNFQLVGDFLVKQQRLDSAPDASKLAAAVDPAFAEKALSAGGCS